MTTNFDFGALLRELRLEHKMSQTELANLLSVSQDTISLWERNKGLPYFLHIKKLAEVFDVSADVLLGIKEY